MASPFNVFRRNQRTMLAVFGVIIMLGFVVGDPLSRYLGHSAAPENPVIVKLNSHTYHASEMAALVHSRQIVKNFLRQVALLCVQKAVLAGQQIQGPVIAVAENLAENWEQQLMARLVPQTEFPSEADGAFRQSGRSQDDAAAVQTVVLAASAEEHGIVLTDQTINDYLKEITQNMVTAAEYEKIVGDMRGEGHMSQGFLFDALRRELLASRYSRMFDYSLFAVPPAQRWEYFKELRQLATVEVVGVPVEKFVSDVPAPSETAVKAFYDKYSEILPIPNSPTPGLKRPAKAQFQFFQASFPDFEKKAMDLITPEEMHTFYDQYKDVYFLERKPNPGDDLDAESDDVKAGEKSPDDKSSDDKTSGDAAGDDSSKKSDQPEKSSTEGEKKPAAGSGTTPPPSTDADKKSSRSVPASSLHLTALVQKADEKKPAAAAADTKPAATTPADAPAAAETKPAATSDEKAGADEKVADEKAAGDEKPAADGAAGTSGAEKDASSDAAAGDKSDGKPAVAYEPFEKVEDEIRKMLAGRKANDLIDETFQRLTPKIRAYGKEFSRYEIEKAEDSAVTPPAELDLPALASSEGLLVHETDLISADEAEADTDLGKSFINRPDRRGYRRVPFVEIGFVDRLYNPAHTQDNNGEHFLSWKVKETPEGVPTFDEARHDVIRVLKFIEARKLALAAAEQLAKEARAAGKPLTEAFAGREGIEVVVTDPFSWMTTGNVAFDPNANQPHLSPVHGVQAPGQEFMAAVFHATPDQIQVAMNDPQTVAYVVQVKKFEPPRDDLEQRFLIEDFRIYGNLAMNDRRSIYVDWLRSLDRDAGVTWFKAEVTTTRRAADRD